MDERLLERPIWNALTSVQTRHAVTSGRAVRFHPEIGPLAAMPSDDVAGLAALARLAAPRELLAMIEKDIISYPPGTMLERQAAALQMVADDPPGPFDHPDIRALGEDDVAEMRALADLTEPGPFASRTHSLGQFWGVRDEAGRLVAMAGERMRMPGFGEVSAVCVHPDARGKGLGVLMVRKAMSNLGAQGLKPFLHSYADNDAAIATYRRCGFRLGREMVITMFRREAD